MRVMIEVNPRGLDEGQAGVARLVVTEHINQMLAVLKKELDEPVGLTWVWGRDVPSQEELQAAKWRVQQMRGLYQRCHFDWHDDFMDQGTQLMRKAYAELKAQQMAFEDRYRDYFDREVNDGEEKES